MRRRRKPSRHPRSVLIDETTFERLEVFFRQDRTDLEEGVNDLLRDVLDFMESRALSREQTGAEMVTLDPETLEQWLRDL